MTIRGSDNRTSARVDRPPVPSDKPVARISGEGLRIGLLTGGHDRSYAHGLAVSLASAGVDVEFVGSDALDGEAVRSNERIHFFNLRGDQSEDAAFVSKVFRLSRYYLRLFAYAFHSRVRILHILWNNKFELFDRTFLMLYYRLCGKKVVLTAHNINVAKRDGRDSWLNRLTLSIQYRLSSHIFVHTDKMRSELQADFAVPNEKISVIPFGLNDTSPRTDLTALQARSRLGLEADDLVLLFFGQIAPYKGLRHLVEAFPAIHQRLPHARLVIAGKVKRGAEDYWQDVEAILAEIECRHRILCRIEHIPDQEIEVYFKAADALVVPYVQIFQSGLPFLAYSFGLPVLATNVGSLSEEIKQNETGFVCEPCDSEALVTMIARYAASELCDELDARRSTIARSARERYSWAKVAEITRAVYEELTHGTLSSGRSSQDFGKPTP